MSYHQWLSGTPKFHLTSSAKDEFAFPKSNNTRSRPKRTVSTMDDTSSRPAPPLPTIDQRSRQATLMTPKAPKMLEGHGIPDDAALNPTDVYYPITPPSETYDTSQDNIDLHQSYHQPDLARDYVDYTKSLGVGQGLPMQQTTNPRSCPISSRDIFSGSNPGGIDQQPKARYGEVMLPSPPMSPPSTKQPLSPRSARPPREKIPAQRQSSRQMRRPPYADPMLHTSTDPHFWSKNCTILKADSYVEPGNVISPTCMVGLPFGGMVEMTLPLPAGEVMGAADFI